MTITLVSAAIAALAATRAAQADQGAPIERDKARYHLFSPTPSALLRDLTTDRPDATETPFTVDAGHIQIETTLLAYGRSRPEADGTFSRSYDFGVTNIRVGLTSTAEFNVVFHPHGVVETYPNGWSPSTRSSGVGGIGLRAKVNFWGNDTFDAPGSNALGLLAFVSLPTDRNNGISPEVVEGGVILPYTVQLTERIGLGINGGIHLAQAETGSSRRIEYLASASFAYAWSDKFGTYYEVAARLNGSDPRGDTVVLSTGLTYKVNDNLQLDAGVLFGMTAAADRINPFLGFSARF